MIEKVKLKEDIEEALLNKDDKIWNTMQSRTLDKIQRLVFVQIKKLTVVLQILNEIDKCIDAHRKVGITRKRAALYMHLLSVFTLDEVKTKKLKEEWDREITTGDGDI